MVTARDLHSKAEKKVAEPTHNGITILVPAKELNSSKKKTERDDKTARIRWKRVNNKS